MGEGVGLAGTRSGDDEQWCRGQSSRGAMLDGPPLLRIEALEIGGCCWHGEEVPESALTIRDSGLDRNDFRMGAHGGDTKTTGDFGERQ